MPNKYLDSVGLAEYTSLIKAELAPKNSPALTGTPTAPTPTVGDDSTKVATTAFVNTKAGNYLPLAGGTLTGNVYTTPYYDSTIVDPKGGQTLIVSKGKVAKGTAPSNNEWHTMVMAVDNSGLTSNANKYGQVETGVKTDGSVETTVQAYKNEASSTTSAKISVGYDANGNAFTSAPTPTAGDNSTKIATTAFVNTAMANGYLPLSGGTMTGEIIRNTYVVKNNVDNSYTEYLGGKDETSSYLVLYGKNHSSAPGRINLRANNGTTNSYLTLDPNGTLTWQGKNIERVNARGSNTNGDYIRYENGIQICWGGFANVSVPRTITYPAAFTTAPAVGIDRGTMMCGAWSATGCNVTMVAGGTSTGQYLKWIAIGTWK